MNKNVLKFITASLMFGLMLCASACSKNNEGYVSALSDSGNTIVVPQGAKRVTVYYRDSNGPSWKEDLPGREDVRKALSVNGCRYTYCGVNDEFEYRRSAPTSLHITLVSSIDKITIVDEDDNKKYLVDQGMLVMR